MPPGFATMTTTADYNRRDYSQANLSNRINAPFTPRLDTAWPQRSNSVPSEIPLTPSESTSSAEPQIYPLPKPLRPEDEGMVEVAFAGELVHNFNRGVFQKNTAEFCVLTNRSLLRFRNSSKALQVFENIWAFGAASRQPVANVNIPADSLMIDIASIISVMEATDRSFSIRIEHLSGSSKQSSALILTPASAAEQMSWMKSLRKAVCKFLPFMSTVVNRDRESAIERLQRHSDVPDKIEDMIIHRVTWREKRSSESSVRETLFNVLLVIGKNNFYILPALLVDADYQRIVTKDRFGLLSIHSLALENRDDTFRIEVRQRGAETKTMSLASSWCETIIQDIRRAVDTITPFYPRRPYKLDVPFGIRNVKIMPFSDISKFEDRGFDKLLEAYCAAYNLDKRRFNYDTANVDSTTPFRKILLKPAKEVSEKTGPYNKYELLAFFRSMRNNTIFREIIFKNVDLAEIELWIPQIDDGWATNDENQDSKVDMLTSELYLLIISNKNLRKLDLTRCNIGSKGHSESALSTFGKAMLTGNVGLNSILIGYNKLLSDDLANLISGIKANRKAIKELSVAGCGLTMVQLGNIIVTLTELKPEHLNVFDISDNHHIVSKEKFELLLKKAKHLKTLRFRKCEPLLDSATLFTTRLRVLDIGGTAISDVMKGMLCAYTQNSSFKHLEILCIDDCNLTGSYLADLFHMIALSNNHTLHINAGYNPIAKEQGALPKFCASIALSEGPASLSLTKTEWDDLSFREFLKVLVYNTVIRRLDLSDIRLLTEPSKDTANMFSAVFERNRVLEELNLKSEEDLTENSGFGRMIVQVFPGLKGNRTLKKLNVRNSGIGDIGAYQLAEVLKRNNTLQSLDMDENQITIEGFIYLIGGLQDNHTLIEFPEPVNDLRFQIRRLTEEIKTTYQTEAELQFFLAHVGGADGRKTRQTLEQQSQIRVDAEKKRTKLPLHVDELMRLVDRNKRIHDQVVEAQMRSLPRPRRSSSSAASTEGSSPSASTLPALPMLSADFRSIPDSPMSVATNSVWTFSPNQNSALGTPLPDVEEFKL